MKSLVIVLVLLLCAAPVFALQGQNQGQLQGQRQGQRMGQGQGQGQGQIGIVDVSTPVSISQSKSVSKVEEGDSVLVYGNTWPTTPSTVGKEEKSFGSIFGSLGFNKTEEQIRLVEQMKITQKLYLDEVIDVDTYLDDMEKAYKQLKTSNKGQKLLGVLPIAERGCSILNLCGLILW